MALPLFLVAGAPLLLGTAAEPNPPRGPQEIPLAIARIFWEYNSSANDLGVHVFLDGEDWKRMKIVNPGGTRIFQVHGFAAYAALGMTELFFEGAEPSLDEFPLEELLALFPEGEYEFEGVTVDGEEIEGASNFTHAIPAGPAVSALVGANDLLVIAWDPVTGPPPGFPDRPIEIVGYQVIVESFQVTVPASVTSVTVSPEFVGSLGPGTHPFEVLAIDAGGSQSITEGTFTL
jgi:hypothetical protein